MATNNGRGGLIVKQKNLTVDYTLKITKVDDGALQLSNNLRTVNWIDDIGGTMLRKVDYYDEMPSLLDANNVAIKGYLGRTVVYTGKGQSYNEPSYQRGESYIAARTIQFVTGCVYNCVPDSGYTWSKLALNKNTNILKFLKSTADILESDKTINIGDYVLIQTSDGYARVLIYCDADYSYSVATGTFQENVKYFSRSGSGTTADPYVYTEVVVTPGQTIPSNNYYTRTATNTYVKMAIGCATIADAKALETASFVNPILYTYNSGTNAYVRTNELNEYVSTFNGCVVGAIQGSSASALTTSTAIASLIRIHEVTASDPAVAFHWELISSEEIESQTPYATVYPISNTCYLSANPSCFYLGTIAADTEILNITLDSSALAVGSYYNNNIVYFDTLSSLAINFTGVGANSSDRTVTVIGDSADDAGKYRAYVEVLPDGSICVDITKIDSGDDANAIAASNVYGVQYDTTTSAVTKVELLRVTSEAGVTESYTTVAAFSNPVCHNFKRCVVKDFSAGPSYYLFSENSMYKYDGKTAADLTGADGDVCVEIPKTYLRVTQRSNNNGGNIITYLVSLTNIQDPPASSGETVLYNGVHPVFRVGSDVLDGQFDEDGLPLHTAKSAIYIGAFETVRCHLGPSVDYCPNTLKIAATDTSSAESYMTDISGRGSFSEETNYPQLENGLATGIESTDATRGYPQKKAKITNSIGRSIAPYRNGTMLYVGIPGVQVVMNSNIIGEPKKTISGTTVSLLPAEINAVFSTASEGEYTYDLASGTFRSGITYYTQVSPGVYEKADVTVGTAIPANTYYVKAFAVKLSDVYEWSGSVVSSTGAPVTCKYRLKHGSTFTTGKDNKWHIYYVYTSGNVVSEHEVFVSTYDATKDTSFNGMAWSPSATYSTAATLTCTTAKVVKQLTVGPLNYGTRNANFVWSNQEYWDSAIAGNPNWALNYRPAIGWERKVYQTIHANNFTNNTSEETFFANNLLCGRKCSSSDSSFSFATGTNKGLFQFSTPSDSVDSILNKPTNIWYGMTSNGAVVTTYSIKYSGNYGGWVYIDALNNILVPDMEDVDQENLYTAVPNQTVQANQRYFTRTGVGPDYTFNDITPEVGTSTSTYVLTSSIKVQVGVAYFKLIDGSYVQDTTLLVGDDLVGITSDQIYAYGKNYYIRYRSFALDDSKDWREGVTYYTEDGKPCDPQPTAETYVPDTYYVEVFKYEMDVHPNYRSGITYYLDATGTVANPQPTEATYVPNEYYVRVYSYNPDPDYQAGGAIDVSTTRFDAKYYEADVYYVAKPKSLIGTTFINNNSPSLDLYDTGYIPADDVLTSTISTPAIALATWTSTSTGLVITYEYSYKEANQNYFLKFDDASFCWVISSADETGDTILYQSDRLDPAACEWIGGSISSVVDSKTFYLNDMHRFTNYTGDERLDDITKYTAGHTITLNTCVYKIKGNAEKTDTTTLVAVPTGHNDRFGRMWKSEAAVASGGATYSVFLWHVSDATVGGTGSYIARTGSDDIGFTGEGVDAFHLTRDTTFQAGKTYYVRTFRSAGSATVKPGEPITRLNTFYEMNDTKSINYYSVTRDTVFVDGKDYFTRTDNFVPLNATVGETIPAFNVYSKSIKEAYDGCWLLAKGYDPETGDPTIYAPFSSDLDVILAKAEANVFGAEQVIGARFAPLNPEAHNCQRTRDKATSVVTNNTLVYKLVSVVDGDISGINALIFFVDEKNNLPHYFEYMSEATIVALNSLCANYAGRWVLVKFTDDKYGTIVEDSTQTATRPTAWSNAVTNIGPWSSSLVFKPAYDTNYSQRTTLRLRRTPAMNLGIEPNDRGLSAHASLDQYLMLMMMIDFGSVDLGSTILGACKRDLTTSSGRHTFYGPSTFAGRTVSLGNNTGSIGYDSEIDININPSDFNVGGSTPASSDCHVAVSWRGIENPLGNIGHYAEGIIPMKKFINGKLTEGYYKCNDNGFYCDSFKYNDGYKYLFDYTGVAFTPKYLSIIPATHYTWITGDNLGYVVTSDITISADKVYYLRTGAGTSSSPYVYTETVFTPGTRKPTSVTLYESRSYGYVNQFDPITLLPTALADNGIKGYWVDELAMLSVDALWHNYRKHMTYCKEHRVYNGLTQNGALSNSYDATVEFELTSDTTFSASTVYYTKSTDSNGLDVYTRAYTFYTKSGSDYSVASGTFANNVDYYISDGNGGYMLAISGSDTTHPRVGTAIPNTTASTAVPANTYYVRNSKNVGSRIQY